MDGEDRRLTAECDSAVDEASRNSADRLAERGGASVKDMRASRSKPLNQFMRMAVVAGVESAVQIHIERGDDLNARDASGMTPLMLSAARNKPAICKLLLSAGADRSLLAPSGKTALEIAIAAGSDDAAAILLAFRTPITAPPPTEATLAPASTPADTPDSPLNSIEAGAARDESDEQARQTKREILTEPGTTKVTASPATVIDEFDEGEFDLSGWETEEEPTRPEVNFAVLSSASAVQIAITEHEPIDSSTEWDDIDAHLPEFALPLARASDAEGRAQLRRLLLRALREGSVPLLAVQDLATNEDRSANPEAEAYLSMVINDLGAEVDERFEYSTASESFEVFVHQEETSDEETALHEALDAIDRATSPRHEPLRIYQREFQRLRLLTAEDEVHLAQSMEVALGAALDALAAWPDGIARTLAASTQAIAGSRPLSSIWIGSAEHDPKPATPEPEGLEAIELAYEARQAPLDEDEEQLEVTIADAVESRFMEALQRLAALAESPNGLEHSFQEIRHTLSNLRLNRRFLLELIDTARGSAPCPGFTRSMDDFCKARDRMTAANLKLVFFHAKKFLYSGEPLDDLAQEGNIGLLKAVDRYDWRRGFRFSTYATWWIRQQIGRYVADKARTIRIPVHIYEKVQRMERVARTFEETTGRKPTDAELAEQMEMPSDKISSLRSIAPEPACIDDLAVDSLISIESRGDYAIPDPAEFVEEIQVNKAVERYISSLSTKDRREEQILRMRFGIGIDEALTLDEIGVRFEVTRERIRQIEAKAIKKLRHPDRFDPFARLVLGLAPNELDGLLMQAQDLGVHVEDDRQGSGHVWVMLVEAQGSKQRRLIRKLSEFGFEFCSGKGYWK